MSEKTRHPPLAVGRRYDRLRLETQDRARRFVREDATPLCGGGTEMAPHEEERPPDSLWGPFSGVLSVDTQPTLRSGHAALLTSTPHAGVTLPTAHT